MLSNHKVVFIQYSTLRYSTLQSCEQYTTRRYSTLHTCVQYTTCRYITQKIFFKVEYLYLQHKTDMCTEQYMQVHYTTNM